MQKRYAFHFLITTDLPFPLPKLTTSVDTWSVWSVFDSWLSC